VTKGVQSAVLRITRAVLSVSFYVAPDSSGSNCKGTNTMSNTYSSVAVRLNAISNAQHIVEQLEAHWAVVLPFGASPADKKALVDATSKAIVMNDMIVASEGERETMGGMRPEIDDLLGSYRASAGLVARGPRSVDAVALKVLKPEGSFPSTDSALARYWKDLPAGLHKYSAQLAARGFTKNDQTRLLDRMSAFLKVYNSKVKQKNATRKAAVARENLFQSLAELTGYFRRLGRAALRGSNDRTAFDRVPIDGTARKAKKVAGPAEDGTAPAAPQLTDVKPSVPEARN
jgi:hypothetical protein